MILGGFGGREDHTVANLQNLFYYAKNGALIMMIDKQNVAFPLIDSDILIPERKGWTISVFSHTEKSYGVTIRGALYPLEDHVLDNDFPLGVGNSAVEDEVYIKVERGALLVMMGLDDKE
jgi:thiamine pyrophosphokinase